jgi:hypothetical protein
MNLRRWAAGRYDRRMQALFVKRGHAGHGTPQLLFRAAGRPGAMWCPACDQPAGPPPPPRPWSRPARAGR